jgi:gliding motility-associated-like protein
MNKFLLKITTKSFVLFATFLLVNSLLTAQTCPASQNPWTWKSHSKWFYGEGNMLTFPNGTGAPTVASTPTAGTWAAGSYESTASACDDNGNLLFYTNGTQVNAANGAVLSTALTTGDENNGQRGSSVQGVMIVRHPLNPDNYYIFCLDDALTPTRGLYYFIYNKVSNTVGGGTRIGNFRTTEQIGATWHNNGVDIWIAIHRSGTADMYSYLLTCTGVSNAATPVISSNVVLNATSQTDNDRSSFKFSWGGTKAVATAHLGGGNWDPANAVVALDFNKTTGAFTKNAAIGTNVTTNPYCVEWTTDDANIYMTEVTTSSIIKMSTAGWGNAATMIASKATINTTGQGGWIKVGGDGRMYRVGSGGSLGTISGNTWTPNAVASPQTITYSLPNMFIPPQDYLEIQPVGPFCNTASAVDMSALWKCKGTSAEDPINYPTAWSGTNVTNPNGMFNPNGLAAGTYVITYTLCAIQDTEHVVITTCNVTCLDTTLKFQPAICAGVNVDLNTLKTNTTSPGTWSIIGAGANFPTINGSTFTTNSNTAGGTYTVRYTLSPAPVDPSCAKYNERTIVVNAKPVVTLVNRIICQGDAAATFDAGAGYTTYNWNNGAGALQTFSSTTAATQTVYVTDAKGCKDTATATLTVNPKPVVTLTNKIICQGDAAASFDAGAGYTTYNWNNGAGALQTFSSTVAATETVYVTDANGCKDTATATLTVNTKPVVTLTNQTICQGDDAATFDAGAGFTTYNWNNGAGASQTFSTTANATHTVYVTDANGCKDTATATLTVNPKPNVSVASKSICQGDAAWVFDAGAGFTTYNWDAGAGAAQTFSTSANGPHTVIITDAKGCKDTATATLTVNPKPAVTLTNRVICQGDAAVTFDAGAGYTSYNWNNGSGASQTFSTTANATHTVFVADANGCKDTASATLTVNPKPAITVADQTKCPLDGAQTFTTSPAGFTTYDWDNGGAATPTLSTSVGGNHTVIVTDANGCKDTATAKLNILTQFDATISVTATQDTVCQSASSFSVTKVMAGGTWSATCGICIDNNGLFNPATATIGSNTITYSNSSSCGDTQTVNIFVLPVITSVLTKDTALCVNQQYTPSNNWLPVDPATLGFPVVGVWNFVGAGNPASLNPVTGAFDAAIAGAGTYKITYSVTMYPCFIQDTITIRVDAMPNPAITAVNPMCQNAAVTNLSATTIGVWTTTAPAGSITGNQFNPTTAGAGNWEVYNTVTNGKCQAKDTITIVVKQAPVINLTPIPDQCLGGPLVDLTQYDAPDTGTWSGNGVTGTNFNPSTVGTKTLTYSIGGLCPTSKTIDVTVQTTPNPSITGDSTICENATTDIQLTADKVGGTWVGSGMNAATGLFTLSGLAPGNYPIQYQMNGVLCKDTAFFNIRVIDVPKTDFIADRLVDCGYTQISFTDVSDSIPVHNTWQFNQGSGTYSDAQFIQIVSFNTPGVFDVSLINHYASGCTSTEYKDDYITVYPLPNAEFHSSPDIISTLNPLADFTDASTSSTNVTDWLWKFTTKGTPTTSTLQNPEVNFSSVNDDTIPVWLFITDAHGCVDSVKHDVILRTNTVLYVPNAFTPNEDGVNDGFIPKGINFDEKGYEFIVFDRWGEVIFKTNNATEAWNGKRDNNLRDAQIDVYVWKVTYVDHFSGIKQDPIVGHVSLIR